LKRRPSLTWVRDSSSARSALAWGTSAWSSWRWPTTGTRCGLHAPTSATTCGWLRWPCGRTPRNWSTHRHAFKTRGVLWMASFAEGACTTASRRAEPTPEVKTILPGAHQAPKRHGRTGGQETRERPNNHRGEEHGEKYAAYAAAPQLNMVLAMAAYAVSHRRRSTLRIFSCSVWASRMLPAPNRKFRPPGGSLK
jgi:hypothetical protein